MASKQCKPIFRFHLSMLFDIFPRHKGVCFVRGNSMAESAFTVTLYNMGIIYRDVNRPGGRANDFCYL